MVVFWLHDAGNLHVLIELAMVSFSSNEKLIFHILRKLSACGDSGSVMLETILLYPGLRYRFLFFSFSNGGFIFIYCKTYNL